MLKTKTTTTKRKIVSMAMAIAIVLSIALPVMPVSAMPGPMGPVPVNGRILTPDKTGDISNWVEIAQYGNYSLIVRANFINVTGNKYGDPSWQTNTFGASTKYMQSYVRDKINRWFSGIPTAPLWDDVLHIGAQLRSYTMQHNATYVLGTTCTVTSLYDGLSLPTMFQAGLGNDVAFALSYSESANFLSNIHFQRNNYLADQPSNIFAVSNIFKVRIPDPSPSFNFMWLRSVGDINNTVGTLGNEGRGRFRVFQDYISSKGLIYPALWVNADIFEPPVVSYNVTYYPNGGTGNTNSYPATANTNHLVQDQGYTRASYTFAGWNTEANGTGTSYQNFDVINVTRNISLYAQWRRGSSIVYHANGGVGDDFVDFGTSGSFTIRSNMFYRPQHNFGVWNTSPDGRGAILPAGLSFSGFVGELHLYATWNRVE